MSHSITASLSSPSFSSLEKVCVKDFSKRKRSEIIPPTISQISKAELSNYRRSNDEYNTWLVKRNLLDDPSKKPKERNSYELNINNPLFRKKIENLSSDEIFFDSGCGNGIAGEEYVRTYPKGATFYGVTLTRPCNEEEEIKWLKRDHLPRLYLFLLDILKFPTASLQGRVSVITDIHGAFRYSGQPSRILAKLAEMLNEGGILFLAFYLHETVDVSPYEDKISLFARKKLIERGSQALLFLYLSTIQGLKIIAPEKDVTPKLIQKRFGLCKDQIFDIFKVSNYEEFCWIFQRTNEPINLDPLYKKEPNSQTYDTRRFQKYHWEVSERNKHLIEELDDFCK